VGLALKMKLVLLVTLLPSPLTFQPLNGDMDHLCHGLPSNQFPACYALPFSTYGQVWDSWTDRQQPSLNASILWECRHNNNSNNTNSQIFIVPFGCSFRDAGNGLIIDQWNLIEQKSLKVLIQNQNCWSKLFVAASLDKVLKTGKHTWKSPSWWMIGPAEGWQINACSCYIPRFGSVDKLEWICCAPCMPELPTCMLSAARLATNAAGAIMAWHEIMSACLGGSVDWDTVRTNPNGLPEEPGFNPW